MKRDQRETQRGLTKRYRDEEETEPEMSSAGLYEHVAKGHPPYLRSCAPYSRASGRVPALAVCQPAGTLRSAWISVS